MRNLFSTRVKIILVVAALLSVGLAILSGITNTTLWIWWCRVFWHPSGLPPLP